MNLKVLIVEDSRSLLYFQRSRIEEEFHYGIDTAMSLAETKELLESGDAADYFIALLDLNLPDAENGEVVDYVLGKGIPVVVFTATNNDDTRDRILSKNVVDYILKNNPNNFDYALRLVKFMHDNRNIEVMIVDDSSTARSELVRLLQRFPLKVYEAKEGTEALEVLKNHPKIKMVITDKNMPVMDGVELTQHIRKDYSMDNLAIIGISSYGNSMTNVNFIKSGANDFIIKPFTDEVFVARFISNMLMLDYIKQARDFANKDYLTGLFNRKYLYEAGEKLYETIRRKGSPMTVCMIDIDHFKGINDTYGHGIGDKAIVALTDILTRSFRTSDIVARYGGEEFCILLSNTDARTAFKVIDAIREKVQVMTLAAGKKQFSFTISAGINDDFSDSLAHMIDIADRKLYQAKENGRNRVVSNTGEAV